MDSPAALQLRYLQTLNNISAENNSTIIFPVPVDVISNMIGMVGASCISAMLQCFAVCTREESVQPRSEERL